VKSLIILIPALLSLAFVASGCVSMSYSSTVSNGQVKQRICAQGDCRSLIGLGTIDYNHDSKTITVTCEGREAITFAADQIRGYNCDAGTLIQ